VARATAAVLTCRHLPLVSGPIQILLALAAVAAAEVLVGVNTWSLMRIGVRRPPPEYFFAPSDF